MKYIFLFSALVIPSIIFAQPAVGGQLSTFLGAVIGFINNILIPLALAIAFIALVWGIVRFFVIGGDSEDGKTKGKDLIIYSLVGFVVIFSFYGLVNVVTSGLGLGGANLIEYNIPTVPISVPVN